MSLKVILCIKFRLSVLDDRVRSWRRNLRRSGNNRWSTCCSLYSILLKSLSSASSMISDTVDPSCSPTLPPRLKSPSIRFLSSAVVKPHQAGEAYFNLATTTGGLVKHVSFYSAPQRWHCKRCTSYGNSVRLSVRPSVCLSHAGIVSKQLHEARCSLHCQIAICV